MKCLVSTVLVVATVSSLFEREARACSPPQPGLQATVPADGAMYPANGHILFLGYGLDLSGVTVTVDGAAATLAEPAPTDALSLMAGEVAKVSPEPSPGQTVTVSGTFCSDPSCEPTTFSWVATEPDTTAPSAGELFDVRYDVHDHPTIQSLGSCAAGGGVRYWVHVATQMVAPPADGRLQPGTTPEHWYVRGTAGGGELAFERVIPVVAPTLELVVPLEDMAVSSPPDLCVEVALFDAAGNELGEIAKTCAACLFRDDGDGTIDEGEYEEPAWTSADVYSGGDCSPGPDPAGLPVGSTDESEADSGCGCATAGAPPSRARLVLLVGAAACASLRRRRRR